MTERSVSSRERALAAQQRREHIYDMWEAGWPPAQIAVELGTTRNTINAALSDMRRAGITMTADKDREFRWAPGT